MKVQATEVTYTMLPTDDLLSFEITAAKEQPNYFDKNQKVCNVEFSISTPGFDKRKVWRNFGPFWPKVGSTKSTLLFDLVTAVDPSQAIKGKTYDTDRLVGKKGRLMMEDYETKELVPMEVDELDSEGEPTGNMIINPDPRRGKPVIKQKVKFIVGLKGAAEAPVAEAAEPAVVGRKLRI